MVLDLIDRICKHAYVLALLLAAVTFGLAPLHLSATERGNVTAVLPDNRITVAATDLPSARAGMETQVFRFNPDWMREIGKATVERVDGDHVVLTYDPATYAWPMGRQGTIVGTSGKNVLLNVGDAIAVGPGVNLVLFEGRTAVGRARVVATRDGQAIGVLTALRGLTGAAIDPETAVGLTATEFIIPNQVTLFAGPIVGTVEAAVIAGALALWLWTLFSPVPGQRVAAAAARVRAGIASAGPSEQAGFLLFLAFPVCLIGVRMGAHFLVRAGEILTTEWWSPLTLLFRAQHWTWPNLQWLPWWVALGALAWWFVYATNTDKNPVRAFLEWVRFRREETLLYRLVPFLPTGLLNWIVHWMVFFLFARSITGFLKANMAAAAGVGWRSAGLPFDTWTQFLTSSAFMFSHAPYIAGLDAAFSIARYLTWSACIVGCLIGYGHTLLSPFLPPLGALLRTGPTPATLRSLPGLVWNTHSIRWVDFTLYGWMVNLLCYDPWAIAAFRVMPHPSGVDPAMTAGPLFYLQPCAELFLNVTYTASIFNLGKRFGVMVDKGVVSRGFYSVVRHPSYTLEALMFAVLYLPRITTPWGALGLLAHPLLYWLRSERDDSFMGDANPDYAPYRERVPWKFVPGVW